MVIIMGIQKSGIYKFFVEERQAVFIQIVLERIKQTNKKQRRKEKEHSSPFYLTRKHNKG